MSNQLKELKKLRANLRKIEDTYVHYNKLFQADGNISKEEGVALEKMEVSIRTINTEMAQREEKLSNGNYFSNVVDEGTELISDIVSSSDDAPMSADELAQKDIDVTFEKDSPAVPSSSISAAVGAGCPNTNADVITVQALLNKNGASLKVDGDCGKKTIDAIKAFQSSKLGYDKPDGRIDVGGGTWKALAGGSSDTSTEDPVDTTTTDGSGDGDDTTTTTDTTTPVDHGEVVEPTGSAIKKSVGLKGKNVKDDVLIVQKLLRDDWNYDIPQNGDCDNLTIRAIGQFQYRFVGSIKKQDSKIDAGGNSWKYLIGEKKPTLALQEDGTLAGAETEDEKKLAEFVKAVGDIQIEVAPNEFIGVRPPYHMNSPKRRKAIDATRAKNSNVAKLINKLGFNDSHGKATPGIIKQFLEDAIAKGYVKDKSSNGLNQFLDKYGITLDCSGLAVQSVNFMEEGNLTRENGASGETLKIVNAASIMRNGTKITKPSDLKAGDMMVVKTHVRIITDVDDQTDGIAFTTFESGAEKNLGYGGGVGDGADGVGERRWLFPNKQKFEKIKRLSGNKWGAMPREDKYVYRRMDAKARKVYE